MEKASAVHALAFSNLLQFLDSQAARRRSISALVSPSSLGR